MQALTQEIELIIKKSITEFIESVVEKHPEIEVDDLMILWNTLSNDSSKTKEKSENIIQDKKVQIKKQESCKESIKSSSGNNKCPYKYIKGDTKGTTCGAKLANGKTYCSRHKKHEGVVKEEKKIMPRPKSVQKNDDDEETEEPPKKKSPDAKIISRVLYKHKPTGHFWHPETTLAFKSFDERVVIGKIADDKIHALTEADIDTCKKWGFVFVSTENKEEAKKKQESDSESDEQDTKKKGSNKEVKKKEETKTKNTSPKNYPKTERKCLIKSSKKKEKICNITRDECSIVIKSSKNKKHEKTKSKKFSSVEEAVKEMQELVSAKIKKGYSIQSPHSIKESSNIESDCESITDIINEIQETSSSESDNDPNNDKKDFIMSALGLKGKKTNKILSKSESEDDIEIEDE